MTAIEPPCVDVIGMGMSPQDLTAVHLQMISAAQILIGGKRHLASFPDVSARRVAIGHDLPRIAELITQEMTSRRIVVLASGDPLYFGIGAYLLRTLGRDRVRVWPNINTVAAAAASLRTYEQLARLAYHGLDAGCRVLVDATFLKRAERDRFRQLADQAESDDEDGRAEADLGEEPCLLELADEVFAALLDRHPGVALAGGGGHPAVLAERFGQS